jgi:polyisoprenoid-binding protein YceI
VHHERRGSGVAAALRMLSATHDEGDEMSSSLLERRTTVAVQPALERWTVDPARTTVEFEVDHFWGLHTVRGRFGRFEGSYVDGPAGLEIELTIDGASVDTGIARRDRHLRSADFLDVDEHPQVRFTSTRVTGLGDGQVRVSGELTAAGTSVPLEFDASVQMIGGELLIEATTTVDQRRFGMSPGPFRNIRHPARMHVATRLVRERPEAQGAHPRQRPRTAWQRSGSSARQSPIDTTSEGRSNG